MLDVQIERIAFRGYGIGYAEDKTVFVPYTIPGDKVRISKTHENSKIIFGRIESYIQKTKDHHEPSCRAFGHQKQCGACDYLDLDYSLQLSIKDGLVSEIFSPLISSDRIDHISPSPITHRYRNKTILPVSGSWKNIHFGMYKRLSHNVVTHDDCLLQPILFDQIFEEIMAFCKDARISATDSDTNNALLRSIGIRCNSDHSEFIVILVTKSGRLPFSNLLVKRLLDRFPMISGIVQNIQRDNTNVLLGKEDKLLYGKYYINTNIGNVKYRVHYRSFFQINSACARLLYDYIKEQVDPGSDVIDAYCGIGSIGLYAADKANRIIGIDEVPEAITDASFNSQLNNVANSHYSCSTAEQFFNTTYPPNRDCCVIIDPPRSGVSKELLEKINGNSARKIIYVSCNPMTLMRDIKILINNGFSIDRIKPFDMFPHTWHIETVAVLTANRMKQE